LLQKIRRGQTKYPWNRSQICDCKDHIKKQNYQGFRPKSPNWKQVMLGPRWNMDG